MIKKDSLLFEWSEMWSLTLRKEHKLKSLEMLRKIFGPKKNEVIWDRYYIIR
jgi:hypothetical protein